MKNKVKSDKQNIKKEKDNNKEKRSKTRKDNVGIIQFFVNKGNINDSDLAWILELRNSDIIQDKKKISSIKYPPRFYDEDLDKYITRLKNNDKITCPKLNKIHKLKKNIFVQNKLFFPKYNHIVLSTPKFNLNGSLINFETTLRNYNSNTRYDNKIPWKELSFSTKKMNYLNKFLPPTKSSSINNLKHVEKIICHPMNRTCSIIEYNNSKIFQAKNSVDFKSTLAAPSFYIEKYKNRFKKENFANIKPLLKSKSDINIYHWQISLRKSKKELEAIEKLKD